MRTRRKNEFPHHLERTIGCTDKEVAKVSGRRLERFA